MGVLIEAPPTPQVIECGDGIDNNGNGLIDGMGSPAGTPECHRNNPMFIGFISCPNWISETINIDVEMNNGNITSYAEYGC